MMHAIYSAADEYRCVGFVATTHRDRVRDIMVSDAGCYASQEATTDTVRRDVLTGQRFMEGIRPWQR
jgi:hypothetical protein